MSDLQRKIKAIISDLETNIKDQDELEYVKNQVYNVALLFIDEMDSLAQMNVKKVDNILQSHANLDDRMAKIEKKLHNIEKEIFVEDDFDFEIVCPYCNHEFVEEFYGEIDGEVRCPECNNVIELKWGQDEIEGGCNPQDCGHCHGGCSLKDDDDDSEN